MQALCSPGHRESWVSCLAAPTVQLSCPPPCPSFLWVFYCWHPAQERTWTTLAPWLSRVCDSGQNPPHVLTSTLGAWGGSEKSREIAKPPGHSRLEGPWQKWCHAPQKCPALFWIGWAEVGKSSEVPEGMHGNSSQGISIHSVLAAHPVTGPGMRWPLLITPLIMWG